MTLKFPVSVLSLLDVFDTTLNTAVQTLLLLVLGKYKTYTEEAIVRAKKPVIDKSQGMFQIWDLSLVNIVNFSKLVTLHNIPRGDLVRTCCAVAHPECI